MSVIGNISKEVMQMLGFGKEKSEVKQPDCCGCDCGGETTICNSKESIAVKIFSMECADSKVLENNIKEAAKQLEKQITVEKVTDIAEIALHGAMELPAIAIDGKILSIGRILTTQEIVKLFQKLEKIEK